MFWIKRENCFKIMTQKTKPIAVLHFYGVHQFHLFCHWCEQQSIKLCTRRRWLAVNWCHTSYQVTLLEITVVLSLRSSFSKPLFSNANFFNETERMFIVEGTNVLLFRAPGQESRKLTWHELKFGKFMLGTLEGFIFHDTCMAQVKKQICQSGIFPALWALNRSYKTAVLSFGHGLQVRGPDPLLNHSATLSY